MISFPRLALASLLATAALAGVGTVEATATGTQLSTPLPEPIGAQDLAVNGSRSFVVYADTPHGHAAAISSRTGHVVWRSRTASRASLVTATSSIVWTAGSGGQSLVAQAAATGRTLRTVKAPDHGRWQTLASSGATLYALSYGTDPNHLDITTFTGKRRVRTVPADVPTACNSVVGAGSLYLACFGSTNAVYRVNPRTGAVLAKSRQPGLDGGVDLAYLHGSLYFLTSKQTNTPPAVVNRVNAKTLTLQRRSAARNMIGIAAAGNHVLGLQSDQQNGHVLVLSPSTLKLTSSIALLTSGYPFFLQATGKYAYVVQVTAYAGPGFPDETLIRVVLPNR